MKLIIKHITRINLRLLTISVVTVMVSQSVFAIDNVTIQDEDDIPSSVLDEVVVIASSSDASEKTQEYTYYTSSTATGLTMTPKETPQSITTITTQQINDQNLETLDDVIQNTSGVTVRNLDGGKTASSARGFDINQYSIDGQKVNYSLAWMTGEDQISTAIYDRAEVVRGASGLTTGSGRPSASINLIRKRANSRIPTAILSINADNYETYGATIDASTPITGDGNVRARFVAEYQDGDTYIDRESKERTVLYSVIDADVTDDTIISGGISYQDSVKNSAMWGALPSFYTDGSEAEWDVSKNASVDWVKLNADTLTYFGSLTHNINERWQLELKGSRSENEGDSKLFYILGNTIDKQTGLGLSEYNGRYDIERNIDAAQASVDGYFEALGHNHEVRFGASYNKNEEIGYEYTPTPNARPIGNFFEWDGSYPEPEWSDRRINTDVTTKEYSLFASGRFQLADPLALVMGTRVTSYDSEGVQAGKNIDISYDDTWIPYVGATYDITDNHTLFASYTSIFEPQSERDTDNNLLSPIEGNNYEMGLKSSNDSDTLQAQFSVFKIEQDNKAQKNGEIIVGSSPPQPAYYEADGATSTGIDVELTGELIPNWKTSIGYTQFHAEDADGKTVNSNYPDRLFKLFTTYDASNWIDGLTLGAGVNWSDERYSLIKNPVTNVNQKRIQKDVTLVGVMARYEMTDNLALQLNADNLLDEKYADVSFDQIFYSDPLTVSGKLTYQF